MDDEIDFRDYYLMLKRNWALALVIFLVIFAAVLVYTFTTPEIYQARSLVMISSQDQTAIILGTAGSKVDIGTQKEIILSYSVLGSLYPDFGGQQFSISAETKKDSNIIEIRVESPNPSVAMAGANRIAIAYINYTRQTKIQDANEVSNFISEQLGYYKQEIEYLNRLSFEYNTSNMTSDEKSKYQTLQREISAKTKLYDYLLSKKEETGIAVKEKSSNAKIIEYAGLPPKPVRPNIPLNLALGLVLAGIISLSVVFIKAQAHQSSKGKPRA